jgi:hypothetical protein
MNRPSVPFRSGRTTHVFLSVVLVFVFSVILTQTAAAQILLNQISTDTFTNTSSQHATEVEPDTFAFGSTMVATFQMGRFVVGGGSSDIGFSTSTDGGATWTNGTLPGLTTFVGGPFARASDPSVAFDSAHGVWLIVTLGINSSTTVLSSSSSDGINWNDPVVVNNNSGFADKTWIACDNSPTSSFIGHCYIEWDDAFSGGQMRMSTSTDGGQTWKAAINVPGAFGLGGQPVVQPNGTVIVPFEGNGIQSFTSTNGGTSWGNVKTVSSINDHGNAGGLRTSPLPSAETDAAGKVYVVWQDCRFRTGCKSNDIVMSTSTNGTTWSAVTRIPTDPVTSTVDHFIPGIAVDPLTSGSTAHLGLTYYFYPQTNCTQSTCRLGVGFTSSQDGGTTWTAGKKIAGPMRLTWIADTDQGRMVGDYMSTSYVNGKAFGVFAKGQLKNGSVFDEAMYTPVTGLTAESGPLFSSLGEQPVPNAKSDHGPRQFYDLDGMVPIPPPKQK